MYDDIRRLCKCMRPFLSRYTGKERDAESGLDYFGARYYSSGVGRWMSPDWSSSPSGVPYATLGDPQSLNLYEYVRNNPLSQVDADGHVIWCQKCLDFAARVAGKIESGLRSARDTFREGFQNLADQTAAGALAQSNNPYGGAELAIGAGAAAYTPVVPEAEGGTISGTVTEVETEATTTTSLLTGLANDAVQNVGSGSGAAYGTAVHSAFADLVDATGNSNLSTEVSYKGGQVVPYGTSGSIRADVVEGPVNAPTQIYDLKTGSAALTPSRVTQIQSNIPGGSNVPVTQIKPQ